MPTLVEMGVLLDLFVAVFLMGIAIYQINREFDHIDASRRSPIRMVHRPSVDLEILDGRRMRAGLVEWSVTESDLADLIFHFHDIGYLGPADAY